MHSGLVAQLVEQRTENPCVGGSIPPQATNRINDLRQLLQVGVFVCARYVRADVRRFSEFNQGSPFFGLITGSILLWVLLILVELRHYPHLSGRSMIND
jgi:hypothetical protein